MIAREARTFERWSLALAARLARSPGLEIDLGAHDVALAWRRAQRDIAARLALALFRETLCDGALRGDTLELGPALLPLRRRAGLGLHQPDLEAPRHPWLEDPRALWAALAGPLPTSIALDASTRARVRDELDDSSFNLALAGLAQSLRPRWAHAHADDPRATDPEHWVTQGHPWHPMTKTRLGLRLAEHARIAPELLATAPLRAVDVRRAAAVATSAFEERLAPWLGKAPEGFVRLPVHGCQLPRLARRLGERWGRDVVPTPWRGRARSLLSVRTVATEGPIGGPPLHLKLALDVHTTSARRIVSPMSVLNGPRVSALIREIQRVDPICARLRVVEETMTAGLRSDGFGADAASLGVIVRDASSFARDDGTAAWVCAGLGSPCPRRGEPLVARLAAAWPGPARARAEAMLERYLEGLVPPVLRFAIHGVALEAHLQNTLVLPPSQPEGALDFVIRDLGGLRLHGPRLRAAGREPTLHPDSFLLTEDPTELQTKVAHTLLHAHLSTLLGWIEDALGLPAARAWAIARRHLEGCLRAWAHEPPLRERCEADLAAFVAPRVRAKALLRMRIDDRSSDYAYVEVDNPLAAAGPEPP